MRKALLILSLVLIFGILSAEEAAKNQEQTKLENSVSDETTKEKEKGVFITPTIGLGGGWPILLTVNTGIDVSFKVVSNFQIGFDIGFRTTPGFYTHPLFFLPIKAKCRFDIPATSPGLKFVGFWFAGGFNLIWVVPDGDAERFLGLGHDTSDDKYSSFLRFTWGIATDFVFKNNMVLRLGLYDALPIPFLPLHFNMEIGYRF